MKQVKVAILFANGFEEVEGLTAVDFLRRAGIDTMITGVGTLNPIGSHNVQIQADLEISDLNHDLDGIVLPGGMPGAANLKNSDQVREICQKIWDQDKLLAAICAAPAVVLYNFGMLIGRKFTCYPGFEKEVNDAEHLSDRVVIDRNLITSKGPATAAVFSIEIIRFLLGNEQADKIAMATLHA